MEFSVCQYKTNSVFRPFGECESSTGLYGWVLMGHITCVGWQVILWYGRWRSVAVRWSQWRAIPLNYLATVSYMCVIYGVLWFGCFQCLDKLHPTASMLSIVFVVTVAYIEEEYIHQFIFTHRWSTD